MKIGLLLPNSKYYPYIGSDLFLSLKHYLGEEHNYVLKDIQFAAPNECQKAVKELVLYESVDLIVGFMGYRSIMAVKPLIQQTKTPLIMCSAGEHPLLKADVNPYMIHLSLGVFQSVYMAFKWALNHIGKNYSYSGAFFEAGYPFLFAADAASRQYGGNLLSVSTTHKDHDAAIAQACNTMLQFDNDFIFLGYHGYDAIETIKYIESNQLFLDKPILVTPFFFDPEILTDNLKHTVVAAKTWTQCNQELKGVFHQTHHREASVFSTLGYEAALLIRHAIGAGWKVKDEFTPLFDGFQMESDRGRLTFDMELNCFDLPHVLHGINCVHNEKLAMPHGNQSIDIEPFDKQILNGFNQELSGWLNTYLCN
jgi:branched-chain amino acid transport system substrate-binding protein